MWTTVAAAVGPSYAGDVADQLVVGFDLDMTLIDTVGGFAATLEVLGAELGITFPTETMTSRLGPPLGHLLRDHMPEERLPRLEVAAPT